MMKNSFTAPTLFPALLCLIVGSTLVLSGCQSFKSVLAKRDNGSLEYQDSKKLAPLQLPTNQDAAPFTPLYPTPDMGENTLVLQNDSGKQYQLPQPQRTITNTAPNN